MSDIEYDADEIAAAGDLWKQSNTGGKLWSLRRFVLTNVFLVYYNKKGEKRGQWDISDCIVRLISPEEAGSKSAQNAFCVAGPRKLYIMNANSGTNRNKWMKVIEEQIEEFRDPDRRFIRTGELIYGKGNLKKKNLLGMGSSVRLLITNYPRILIIDPLAKVVRQQISWNRDEPPILVKGNPIRFKIVYAEKEHNFEDIENGADYWDDVFKRFPQMKYFVPKRRNTLTIDFNDYSKSAKNFSGFEDNGDSQRLAPEESEQTAVNTKFLQDAKSNINDLVAALANKIDEIDSMGDMSGADGIYGDDSSAAAELRVLKKAQLRILKDNVSILSNNLDSLMARNIETGGKSFIDMTAIESVIRETGKMVVMLDKEEILNERESKGNKPPTLNDEMNQMDEMFAEMEQEAFALDDMIANVEAISFGDNLLEELEAAFDSINPTGNIAVTPANFDPKDSNRRPAKWNDVRMKRVLIKEYVDRMEGVPEDVIKENREKNLILEEEIMVQEVLRHERLLNMESLNEDGINAASIAVTKDNYDEFDPVVRPPGWRAIRLKRVVAKEETLRNLGVDEETIVLSRPQKVLEEEKLMMKEIASDGKLKSMMEPDSSLSAIDLEINEETFNPYDSSVRPPGWSAIRMKRILAKENILGADKELLLATRPAREIEEENFMVMDVLKNGVVGEMNEEVIVPKTFYLPAETIVINNLTYDPESDVRPAGWMELRTKRVLMKERADRNAGVSESVILESRKQREKAEESIMKNEILNYGSVLNIGPSESSNGGFLDNLRPNLMNTKALAAKRALTRKVDLPEEELLLKDEMLVYGTPLELGQASLSPSRLLFTGDNFDPVDPTRRPAGWEDLKIKRVLAKEKAANITSTTRTPSRIQRERDEEECMLNEAINYLAHSRKFGNVVSYDENAVTSSGLNLKEYDPNNPARRPAGWRELRAKRIYTRQRALGTSEDFTTDPIREREEEAVMMREVANYNNVFAFTDGVVKPYDDLVISDLTFDPKTKDKRPSGWENLKARRVLARELADRALGVSDLVIYDKRDQKLAEEEDKMINEAAKYKNLLSLPQTYGNMFSAGVNVADVKPNTDKRPSGWKELRKRRILAKEQAIGALGNDYANTADRLKFSNDDRELALRDFCNQHQKPLKAVDLSETVLGWKQIRDRRVYTKERAGKLEDLRVDSILERQAKEESAMKRELETYGNILIPKALSNGLSVSNLAVEDNFDPSNPLTRPRGWDELRTRRIAAKLKAFGADANANPQTIAAREAYENELMAKEITNYVPFQARFGKPFDTDLGVEDSKLKFDKFDAKSTSRPTGWNELRLKRVYIKERVAGVNTDDLAELRLIREKEEDAEMIKELESFGKVLAFKGGDMDGIAPSSVSITNLKPNDLSNRPQGWNELKVSRVLAKEAACKISDASRRPLREAEEDLMMVDEAAMYGTVFKLGEKYFSEAPIGWKELRLKRVYAKERAGGLDDIAEDDFRDLLIKEEAAMRNEIDNYGKILTYGGPKENDLQLADLVFTKTNFDAKDPNKRPPGWDRVLRNRVLTKESAAKVDERTLAKMRPLREREEEELMLKELANYIPYQAEVGTVFNYGTPGNSVFQPADLTINSSTFDPAYYLKRPHGWNELRDRRVFAKERAAKVDMSNFEIERVRPLREQEEEKEMTKEVEFYGTVFDIKKSDQTAYDLSGLSFTNANFDPKNFSKRPEGWDELKLRRVRAKELASGADPSTILRFRPQRLIEEEDLMLAEVARYGQVMKVRKPGYIVSQPQTFRPANLTITSKSYNPDVSTVRPTGWSELRKKRLYAKERVAGLDNESPETLSIREKKEEELMKNEVKSYGVVLDYGAPKESVIEFLSDLDINASNFDANDPNKRPPGWKEVKANRILTREKVSGVPVAKDEQTQRRREDLEEELMLNEIMNFIPFQGTHGRVINIGTPGNSILKPADLAITTRTYNTAEGKRPSGWNELKARRIHLKECAAPVDTDPEEIIQLRSIRDDQEELLMTKEVDTYGKVMDFKDPGETVLKMSTLVLTPQNYDPSIASKRPPGWYELRSNRVMSKEVAANVDRSTILKLRPIREQEEEDLMIAESATYGAPLAIKSGTSQNHDMSDAREREEENSMLSEIRNYSAVMDFGEPADEYPMALANIDLSSDFYDPSDPSRRPTGWNEVRSKRIHAKEVALRSIQLLPVQSIAIREKKEEDAMIREVESYGGILNFDEDDGNIVLNIANLDLSSAAFDPANPRKRPPGWETLKLRRVMAKELASGSSPVLIALMRPDRLDDEEELMLDEYSGYGRIFDIQPPERNPFVLEPADLIITHLNFDPNNPAIRPLGWDELKRLRVLAKERAANIDPRTAISMRPKREEEEEILMVNEVLNYGYVFNAPIIPASMPGANKSRNVKDNGTLVIDLNKFNPSDLSTRPKGWANLRMMRVFAKEDIDRSLGVGESEILDKRAERIKQEEDLMIDEVRKYGKVLDMSTSDNNTVRLDINANTFDPKTDKRPRGWAAILDKRMYAKELTDATTRGLSDLSIGALRKKRREAEDAKMVWEVQTYGNVLTVGGPGSSDVMIGVLTFDPTNPIKRPAGWATLRKRRVAALEKVDREMGISEDKIQEKQVQRLKVEEDNMLHEVTEYGVVLNLPYGFTERAPSNFSDMVINDSNFDLKDPSKRPEGWAKLRMKRVFAKEEIDRNNGVSEETILDNREKRKAEEESLMTKEVLTYGNAFGVGMDDADVSNGQQMLINKETYDMRDSARRPPGWYHVRSHRLNAKERTLGRSHPSVSRPKAQRENEEEDLMTKEINDYGNVLSTNGDLPSGGRASTLILNKSVYDIKDYTKRPLNWNALRSVRVTSKENASRTNGVKLTGTRDDLEKLEDVKMISEMETYGHPLALGAPFKKAVTAEDLIVNESTFDVKDPDKRPEGWMEVRNNRVLAKEAAANVDKKSLTIVRPKREQEEEAQMLLEIEQYNRVMPILVIEASDLNIDPRQFDPKDAKIRPNGWMQKRSERVQAKEIAKGVVQKTRLALRAQREQSEEQTMMGEVLNYGKLFRYEYQPIPGFGEVTQSAAPPSWDQLLLRRVLAKELAAAATGDNKYLLALRSQRIEEENALMKQELSLYGTILTTEGLGNNSLTPSNIVINELNYNPATDLRPTGWTEVRKKRVMEKEFVTRASQETIQQLRPAREKVEEAAMNAEIAVYNTLVSSASQLKVADIDLAGFDPRKSANNRPQEWTDLRSKRILAKEIITGSGSKFYQARQTQLEKMEEELMTNEFINFGVVFEAYSTQQTTAAAHATGLSVSNPDIILNSKTYESSTNKRPHGWADIRNERVDVIESVNKTNKVNTARSDLDRDEEATMIGEVNQYGNILCLAHRGNPSNSVQASDLVFDPLTFNPKDAKLRPLGWTEVRAKRVYARETAERALGVPEDKITTSHAAKEKKEETLMLEEYSMYGFVLNRNDPVQPLDIDITTTSYDANNATKRPVGWKEIRMKRILMKECASRQGDSVDEKTILEGRKTLEKEEETAMMNEVKKYHAVLAVAGPLDDPYRCQLDMELSERTFDPKSLLKRPPAWSELRMRRIIAKEVIDRQAGFSEAAMIEKRPQTAATIEKQMLQEVIDYGHVLGAPVKSSASDPLTNPIGMLQISSTNFDPNDPSVRPPGWNDLKTKRIHFRNAFDRLMGVSEEAIREKAPQREREEEKAMVEDVMKHYIATKVRDRGATNDLRTSKARTRTNTSIATSNIVITEDNFDPRNPSKRPDGWIALRNKRVVVKEQIDRLAGMDEDTIAYMRDDRELEEEELMIMEVQELGEVLGVRKLDDKKAVKIIDITKDNFVANDLTKRPSGWTELRMKRVMLKEHIDRLNGVDEAGIIEARPDREIDEEVAMIEEAETFGRVLAVTETGKVQADAGNGTAPEKSAKSIREKRQMVKEQFDRLGSVKDDRIIEHNVGDLQDTLSRKMNKSEMLGQLSTRKTSMLLENQHSRNSMSSSALVLPPVEAIVITPTNFDPQMEEKRPTGWSGIRLRRVHRKEQLDRLRGVNEETIVEKRKQRIKEEDDVMVKEVLQHGNVIGLGGIDPKAAKQQEQEKKGGGNYRSGDDVNFEKLEITKDNFDPLDESKRPPGWAAIRKKRIYKREQLDRLRGVAEAVIQDRRAQREKEEEEAMLKEVSLYGNVLGPGGMKKPVEEESPEELEMNFDPADFDASTNKRPKGWATVKLRRVYIKEWKDRKDGLDEEEIMEKRYQREQEAEQEMIQEMSVNGRIRAFERAIQRNKKNTNLQGFQKSLENYKKGVIHNNQGEVARSKQAPRRNSIRSERGRRGSFQQSMEKASELSKFINQANSTLESLADKVADNLTENASASGRTAANGSRLKNGNGNVPAPAPPRIVAPRARPIAKAQLSREKERDKSPDEPPIKISSDNRNGSGSGSGNGIAYGSRIVSDDAGRIAETANRAPSGRFDLVQTRDRPTAALSIRSNPLLAQSRHQVSPDRK